MGKLIHFPNAAQRVGHKYRQEEIGRISQLLKLCDEDMQTIVEQIEQLNEELQVLTKEYEAMIGRLNELLAVEGEETDDK